jgi:MEDS: MEthanogen/methylotroph, DcmR Sensory domain/STAS domain
MPVPVPAALAPGLSDHVCHAYDGVPELRRQARPYLLAGIALGQRPIVVAPARQLELAREIAAEVEAEAGDGVPVGAVELGQVPGSGSVDIEATLQAFDGALSRALDQGYAGLRAVALLTHIATEPFLRQSWATWEHAVGEWQSLRPVASACSFDRGVLGDKAVQELACLHPRVLTTGPLVPFRLYFRGGQLVLEGEVDSFSASLLAQALTHVGAAPGERLVIDARGLTFLNHRGLTALVEGLARRSGGVTLLGGPALVERMCAGLGIPQDVLDVLPCPW